MLYNAETKDLILHVPGFQKTRVESLVMGGYKSVGRIESELTRAEIKTAMQLKLQAKYDKMSEGITEAFKVLRDAIN